MIDNANRTAHEKCMARLKRMHRVEDEDDELYDKLYYDELLSIKKRRKRAQKI